MGTRDRLLIGRVVEREVQRHPNIGSWSAMVRASKVGRTTLYRVRDGDPTIAVKTLARIEAALGLPYDTLVTVGVHDTDGLLELGVDPALVSWVRKEIVKSEPDARNVGEAV